MNKPCVLQDGTGTAAGNMIRDRTLFDERIQGRQLNPVLRIYRFSPESVTVGYGLWHSKSFQRQKESLGAEAVCRPTGGGIVRHGNDLIYTLIVPCHNRPELGKAKESYRTIHEVIRKALKTSGIESTLFNLASNANSNFCFEKPVEYDLMMGDKKIAGAAQRRSHGWLLHQGSIGWDLIGQLGRRLNEVEFRKTLADEFSNWLKEEMFAAKQGGVNSHGNLCITGLRILLK